ncbi:uncharacterized protein P884DRAFT_51138 [Thermothelomyces heterothallicus CBS 202.75]|uniref:uncharacterized protein n=1 Tax=Thermothelomyces heterothallicus CBS 202.75 TaxID=1149848 RepID=UPI0037439F46
MSPELEPDHALKMATESVSSLFPNRPIRPLPKRRLRERLSPEVAESIQYPRLPQSSTSLFAFPYPLPEESPEPGRSAVRDTGSPHEQRKPQSNEVPNDRKAEDTALKQGTTGRPALQHTRLVTRPKPEHGRYADALPLSSTASSADGYDPFENTNNKKRKIPTAGDSAPSGGHVANDSGTGTGSLAAGAQSAEGHGEDFTAPSASGSLASSVHNIPGPGRGRFGRPRSGKNPLRPLYDSTNSWAGRTAKPRAVSKGESTGIISNAIANAEKLPPHHGQENISLLHQPLPNKRSPASTQFTFTCDSQVPGSLAWPGSDRKMAMPQHQGATVSQGKENWSRTSQSAQNGHPAPAMPQAADAAKEAPSRGGAGGQSQHTAPPQKASRRSATKEYLAAARARRRETQLYNKRHPPKPEDMWICHFCEYEWIFGHPPEALVRAYEIKERKQRQLEEQRRAQWERMKKGKHKGRKNSKLPAKNSHAAHDSHHHADGGGGAHGGHYDHGDQGDEYYDDEYYEDEEYDAEEEVAIEHGPGSLGRHDDTPAHFGDSSAIHDGGGT